MNGSASNSSSFSWLSTSGITGFTPSSTVLNAYYSPSAFDISNGSVELTLTASSDYCASVDSTRMINLLAPPEANFKIDSTCQNTGTHFTDLSTVTGGTISSWHYDFGDNITSIAEKPIHVYFGSGYFDIELVVGSTNGCFGTLTQSVFINPVPQPSFSYSTVCLNSEVDFDNTSFISLGEMVEWNWNFNNSSSISEDENPSNTFITIGAVPVVLEVVSDSGCVASITEVITVLAGPTADFTHSPTIAFTLENIVFTDQSFDGPIENWLWEFGDLSGGNSQNENHQYVDAGGYDVTLTVTDEDDCKHSITKHNIYW